MTALSGGANTTAQIRLKPGNGPATSLRALIVAEVTEIFMNAQHKGWGYAAGVNNEQSCGEALSLFLTEQFQLHIGVTLGSTNSGDAWLNSSLPTTNSNSTRFYDGPQGYDYGSRVDYVNSTLNWPGNGPGDRLLDLISLLSLSPARLHHSRDHRRCAWLQLERPAERRRLPARRIPEPHRRQLRSLPLLRPAPGQRLSSGPGRLHSRIEPGRSLAVGALPVLVRQEYLRKG